MSGSAGTLRAYATLLRVPNLATAPPDVLLGAALVAPVADIRLAPLAGLCVASVLLYAGGTTLNDYVDAAEDARERPERPIPSGEVSRTAALAVGLSFLVCGVAVAAATKPQSGGVAAALTACILLYDGVFKHRPVGVVFMGGARGLNVLLGVSLGGALLDLSPIVLVVPAVVFVYIAAVTFMAAGETVGDNRGAVALAIGAVALAGLAVVVRLGVRSPGLAATALTFVLVAGFLAWTGQALRRAYLTPRPETVGPAVGTCVLAQVVLDGAFASTVGPAWGLATVGLLVPAVGLSRVFDVS
jgi:4-hydroxybenzoate polyprenyltransferase